MREEENFTGFRVLYSTQPTGGIVGAVIEPRHCDLATWALRTEQVRRMAPLFFAQLSRGSGNGVRRAML